MSNSDQWVCRTSLLFIVQLLNTILSTVCPVASNGRVNVRQIIRNEEVGMIYFKVHSHHLLGRIEKNMKNMS